MAVGLIHQGPLDTSSARSVDLWKYFEDRGAKLKESLFNVLVWIVGLASLVLGFVLKEGFATGSALTLITHPGL